MSRDMLDHVRSHRPNRTTLADYFGIASGSPDLAERHPFPSASVRTRRTSHTIASSDQALQSWNHSPPTGPSILAAWQGRHRLPVPLTPDETSATQSSCICVRA